MRQLGVSYSCFKTHIASQIFKRTANISKRFKSFTESTTLASILQTYDEHQQIFKRTTSIGEHSSNVQQNSSNVQQNSRLLQVFASTVWTYDEMYIVLQIIWNLLQTLQTFSEHWQWLQINVPSNKRSESISERASSSSFQTNVRRKIINNRPFLSLKQTFDEHQRWLQYINGRKVALDNKNI